MFKKKLVGFAAILFSLLCGCSSVGTVSAEDVSESFANPFTANLEVVCGGSEYSAALTRDADSIDVLLEAPTLFKGMSISFADGGESAVIEYKGISFSLESADIPYASAVSAVVDALNSAAGGELPEAMVKDGETVIGGDGFELRFIAAEATEDIPFSEITLTLPDRDIVAHITNFKPAI
ncbi:MAG: hypothetical protein IJO96_00930 [Oscillospiraceae bacterium]|nr:hypothetical protein [Oscillospiraceae bacterium]